MKGMKKVEKAPKSKQGVFLMHLKAFLFFAFLLFLANTAATPTPPSIAAPWGSKSGLVGVSHHLMFRTVASKFLRDIDELRGRVHPHPFFSHLDQKAKRPRGSRKRRTRTACNTLMSWVKGQLSIPDIPTNSSPYPDTLDSSDYIAALADIQTCCGSGSRATWPPHKVTKVERTSR